MKPDLYRVAHSCLTNLTHLEPHHRVLVVTDAETGHIGELFANAAGALAAEVSMITMQTRRKHGEEPPGTVAAAMLQADLIVQAVKYALTHTAATRAALAQDAQVFVLRGATEEMLLSDIINVDWAELRRVTRNVADRLSAASELRVTTEAGTDLLMSLRGRDAVALAGGTSPGRFGGPRSGEAAIAPVEGSANGTVVIEHSMDNLGLLDAPITLLIEAGRATSVQGGGGAEELRRLLGESDKNATNLAEFAIGTNPNARFTGNLATDKKVRGSAHVALGDSRSLGGSIESDLHVDGMLLRPTVRVDGELLVDHGELILTDRASA